MSQPLLGVRPRTSPRSLQAKAVDQRCSLTRGSDDLAFGSMTMPRRIKQNAASVVVPAILMLVALTLWWSADSHVARIRDVRLVPTANDNMISGMRQRKTQRKARVEPRIEELLADGEDDEDDDEDDEEEDDTEEVSNGVSNSFERVTELGSQTLTQPPTERKVLDFRAVFERLAQIGPEDYDEDEEVFVSHKKHKLKLHLTCPNKVKNVTLPYENNYSNHVETTGLVLRRPELVAFEKGNIPVILSVPHGASAKDIIFKWQQNNLPPRPTAVSKRTRTFHRLHRDAHTHALSQEIVATLRSRYRKKPYVVTALFHRKFIDVNRRINGSESCCPRIWPKCTAIADYRDLPDGTPDLEWANKVNLARELYDEYHSRIMESMNEITQRFPGQPIWLLDIHAQKAKGHENLKTTTESLAETIIIGTQDGRLVKSRSKLFKRGGFIRNIQRKNVTVYPPASSIPDHPRYNGGNLISEFGYNSTIGADCNALQLEFGLRLRSNQTLRVNAIGAVASAIHKATRRKKK